MINPVGVIVAHADDEILGCGGSIAHFVALGRPVHVLILCDGVSSRFESNKHIEKNSYEVRKKASHEANEIIGTTSITQFNFPDNRLDSIDLLNLVKHIESFVIKHQVSTILTHHSGDVNIDHRLTHDAVIAACRPQPLSLVRELLFIEIPSSTEWRPQSSNFIFSPNYFIDISNFLSLKLKAMEAYADELRNFPHPRSLKAIQALSNWRGASVGLNAAEAFILGRKIIS